MPENTKKPSEKESKKTETRKFKAEVSQVLDIVVNSLYIHREIFVRELVSNAFDALEKMRHESLTRKKYVGKDAPFEIRIETDKENHTITVTDTGVGMTHEELTNNLGTIAHSGTLEYVKNLAGKEDISQEMIGKFGVGFYSSFMVSSEVRVKTRSFIPSERGYEWISNGVGKYTITETENLPRGTAVTVLLKEDAHEFEDSENIKSIIKKYSNFVPFPILVNGERVNTIQAVWLKSTSEVTEDEYKDFFKFISNSEEDPLYKLHLTSDAPIQLASILYIPTTNLEKFGFFKLKPSVNLYCKKILLQQHTENLIPEYMRFVTGIVDSADLSLNISRETIQDDIVFRKLGKFLTKRFLRFLADQAKKDQEKYRTFWDTFGMFIKEGIITDFEHRTDLTKLLRFKSSKVEKDEFVSFEHYVNRCRDNQNSIYYLSGSTQDEIEHGPYIETFRERKLEVLYLFDPIDDFVMTSLQEFEGKKLISADSANLDLPPLDRDENSRICFIFQRGREPCYLDEGNTRRQGEGCSESQRSIDRPAIIVNPETGITTGMRRVIKAAGKQYIGEGSHILEINLHHPLILMLQKLREGKTDKGFLQSCVEQIYDNALTEAGLMENPRTMVERIYDIMERALKKEEKSTGKKNKK